jgi:hypothetical protein
MQKEEIANKLESGDLTKETIASTIATSEQNESTVA